MGPTYLVLLRGGDAATVLYEGTDEDAARGALDAGVVEYKRTHSGGEYGVLLVAVRTEAHL